MKTRALGALLLILFFGTHGWTQEKTQYRRKFLDPKTQVSDDPRRIVVKPGPRGPEGTPPADREREQQNTRLHYQQPNVRLPRCP